MSTAALQNKITKKDTYGDLTGSRDGDVTVTNGHATKEVVLPLGTVIGKNSTKTGISQYEWSLVDSATKTAFSLTGYLPGWVENGCKITEGSSATDLLLAVEAGEIRNSDGSYVSVAAAVDVTITTAPSAGNKRIDLVKVSKTGVVSVVAGTVVANAATAVAPTPGYSDIALAQVAVASSVTLIANASITDVRPRP